MSFERSSDATHCPLTFRTQRQIRAQADRQRIDVLFDAAVLGSASIAEYLSEAGYQTKVAGQ
jgi:hypothetical protein